MFSHHASSEQEKLTEVFSSDFLFDKLDSCVKKTAAINRFSIKWVQSLFKYFDQHTFLICGMTGSAYRTRTSKREKKNNNKETFRQI